MTSLHAPRTPSYIGLTPASDTARRVHQAASRKRDTAPEIALRRVLHARGLRYRLDARDLPGRPDLVFAPARVVVFVDGDFWHGRNLAERVSKLSVGHNAPYWVAKITANATRDLRNNARLVALGWRVLRVWESDIHADLESVANSIEATCSATDPGT